MIDTVQAVLLFVIVLLTILFVVLGIQVFFLLKDLRMSLKRTNKILDDVEIITAGIAEPVSSLSTFLSSSSALSVAAKVFSIFRKRKKD